MKDLMEGVGAEIAGGGDADGAVGGDDVGVADLRVVVEVGAEAAEELDLKTSEATAVADCKTPCVFEGVADGVDGGLVGGAEEWARDGGEEMGMFVAVEVSDGDAVALELLD